MLLWFELKLLKCYLHNHFWKIVNQLGILSVFLHGKIVSDVYVKILEDLNIKNGKVL